jgi:cytidine deaminase
VGAQKIRPKGGVNDEVASVVGHLCRRRPAVEHLINQGVGSYDTLCADKLVLPCGVNHLSIQDAVNHAAANDDTILVGSRNLQRTHHRQQKRANYPLSAMVLTEPSSDAPELVPAAVFTSLAMGHMCS